MSFRKRLHAWLLAKGAESPEVETERLKRELFSGMRGLVVEIGSGPGSNLPYFPKGITLVAVEPNSHMREYFEARAHTIGFNNYKFLTSSAEEIPLGDNTADAVVSTRVLCSVRDLTKVLHEVRRLLKPAGEFIFIEHVAAPRRSLLYFFQKIFKLPWGFIADGCRPDQETLYLIKRAGFSEVKAESLKIGNGLIAPHIFGIARK
ncbi:MAG: class I SAM-dependent methyltransferase [bacterium]|nr:class I SAM-dependent methyltransferase [bacterium]